MVGDIQGLSSNEGINYKGQKIIVVLNTTALRWQIGMSTYVAL